MKSQLPYRDHCKLHWVCKQTDCCILLLCWLHSYNFDKTSIHIVYCPNTKFNALQDWPKIYIIKISSHSGRAAVMPGWGAFGFKFPPFVIGRLFTQNGRIKREICGAYYPQNKIVYVLQTKGWMDWPTYASWVQCVLSPCAVNHHVYLVQEKCSDHLHNNSISTLNSLGIEVEFIPEGYTPVIHMTWTKVFTSHSSTTFKRKVLHGWCINQLTRVVIVCIMSFYHLLSGCGLEFIRN